MKVNRVLILGTIPPPIGGVTVHTLRLISSLESIGYSYEFIDLRQRTSNNKVSLNKYISNIFKLFRLRNIDVVHYQLNNISELALCIMINIITKHRIISTVHSFRPELFSKTKKKLFRFIKKSKVEFIAPSDIIKETLISEGIVQENIRVLNTYLPPSELEISENLPYEVTKFLNNRKNIIVANASKLYKDDLDEDVYGLDMCIEACKVISDSNFIFCVPSIKDEEYYYECIKKIKDYRIDKRFLIVNKSISLVSLFRYADLFVRPTTTDSFGISVAEALSMGIPAVASDVCERAEGTITFKSRNMYSFIKKIEFAIDNKENSSNRYTSNKELETYLEIYSY